MSSFDDISKYIDDGDYRKAIEHLDIIISKDPNNARAFYMRGKFAFIELQNEDFDKNNYDAGKALIYSAIEYDLNKSIDIDPNISDAYRGLMYLNRDLKNVDKEREYAQILFEKDSAAYDALLILASSYLNNGENEADFHQAIGYYDDFINSADSASSRIARFERGLCYYNLNVLPKADIEANKLIYDFPFYDDAYFLKGIILSKNGIQSEFYDDAIFFLDRAVELNNLNFNAIYERAEWYFNKGNYRKAIENYNELLNHNNKYRLDALLGKVQALHDLIIENDDKYYPDSHQEREDLAEVFYLLDKIINTLGICSIQYRYYRGNLYAYQGEIKKSIQEFKNIIKENKESWIYEKIAELYYNYAYSEDDYKEALKYLSHIDKIDYKYSTYYILIFSNYELKNYETTAEICKEFFEYLYEDDEDSYYIRFIYAYSLQMIGSNNYELILDNFMRCLNGNLDKAVIYRSIAKIMLYNLSNDYNDNGINMLKKAISLNDALSYYIYAKELFYGDIITPYPELAIGMSNMALDIDKTLECALIIIGRAYELGRGIEKNCNKAFETYYKAKEIADMYNLKSSCAYALIAHCYYRGIGTEKNEKIAFEIIDNIINISGKESNDYAILLYSYFALNNIEGFNLANALTLFDNIEKYSNNLYAIMILKRIYKKLERYKDVKRISKIENNALANIGELNLNYLRKYIKNFNNFYPILN